MGENVESLAEIKTDNIHWAADSILMYQVSHLIAEVYEVGEAWLVLDGSMLTTPNDLHVPGNGFQD